MEENTRLSDLFERARNEAPKTSFEELKGHFLATGAVAGAGLLAKWAALSFKLKVIIMTAAVSILTISTLVVVNSLQPTSVNSEKSAEQMTPERVGIIEVRSEDGVEQTITYNEKQEVIGITIDSSAEAKADAKKIKLDFQVSDEIRDIHATHISKLDNITRSLKVPADSLRMKKFLITEKSTNEEIENIRQQAIDAGLRFTFDTKIRARKIRRITIEMSKDSKKWNSKITGTDSFSFEFGWWEDREGSFTKFLCDEDLMIGD